MNTPEQNTIRRPNPRPLHFTPAEWRRLLEDRTFLDEPDNSYQPPRRLMGVPVVIVRDHRSFVWDR